MDESWTQAKFLEVAIPEEQSATSAAILLEARKHAKANFKVETPDWVPSGRWQRNWEEEKEVGRGTKEKERR